MPKIRHDTEYVQTKCNAVNIGASALLAAVIAALLEVQQCLCRCDGRQTLFLQLAVHNVKGLLVQPLHVALTAAGLVVWEEATSVVDVEGQD